MEFIYKGMTFVYEPKGNKDGFIFVHKLSGHGFFTRDMSDFWGKVTKKTAKDICKSFIESSSGRIKVINTYLKHYPEKK